MHFDPKSIFMLLFWFLMCLEESNCDNDSCPKYCRCYMWSVQTGKMRRADCINRKLFNIEIEVPQTVQALDLSNNSIATLDNYGFKNLGFLELKYLNLQFNKISTIGLHAFADLNDLQKIDLSNNHLHYLLLGTFHDTPALRALHLSHNKLEKSTSAPFLDIPGLVELDISHCQIGNIHVEYFSQLPSVKKLNLSDNQLIRVDAKTLYPLKNLREVDLSRNPWSCDGVTTELQQWLKNKLISDTTACTKDEDKFAKIITAVSDNNQTETEGLEEDISHFWFDTDEKENVHYKPKTKTEIKNYDIHPEFLYNIVENIPSIWAMIIGFQVGVVITMFGMYIWLKGPKLSKVGPRNFRRPRSLRIASHNNEILWTELESDTPNCPETPPPPYHPYQSTTHQL